jgi:hypothetical protein
MLQQWAFWHATYAEYDSDMTSGATSRCPLQPMASVMAVM